jgi:hypothetical protein
LDVGEPVVLLGQQRHRQGAPAHRKRGLAACEQGRWVWYVITAQLVNELVESRR